jgi:hypothetical protein
LSETAATSWHGGVNLMANYFETLAAVDCSRHIEKKGRFSYLSWPFAIQELLTRFPDSIWRVIENPDGWPYWVTPAGAFVKVEVTVIAEGFDVARTQVHPVLDANNRPIMEPNAFQVNTSIQRALVKAIALHGLGLSIYAGEDLPISTDDGPMTTATNPLFVEVQHAILAAAREIGWSATDATADFTSWSKGTAPADADLPTLKAYLEYLQKTAVPA